MQEKKNLDPSIMKFIEPTQVALDSFINEEIVPRCNAQGIPPKIKSYYKTNRKVIRKIR